VKILTQSYKIVKTGSTNSESEIEPKVKMMLIKCAKCGRLFDSSFTAEDFQRLSADQLESGTLHLCVHCGHLGLYRIRDYIESHP
jgi:DNA-directed RNA polymerase subunit RPC12/RpoP